jgi:hypothetical protein
VAGLLAQAPPEVAPGVAQFYLPVTGQSPPGSGGLLYQPGLLGCAEVDFLDKRRGLEHHQSYRLLAQPSAAWPTAERLAVATATAPAPGAHWATVPEALNSAKKLKALEKAFTDCLYNGAKLTLLENAKLGLVGGPGEDILAFRERCRAAARQELEKAFVAEKSKYQPKFQALGARLPEGTPWDARSGFSLLNLVNPLNYLPWPFSGKQAPPSDKEGRRRQEALRRLEGE